MGACHSLDSDDSLDSRGSLSGSVGEGGSFYESGLGMGGLANGVSLIRVRTGTGRIEPTFTCEELDLHQSLSPSPSPSPSPLDSPEYYHHNGSIWSNVEPFMSPATVTLAVFDEAQFQQHPQQHHSSRLLRRSTDGKDGPSSNLNLGGGGGSSSTDHKNWHRPSSRWLVEATKNALPHSSYESSNFTSQSAPSSSLHPPHHLASTTQQPNLSGTGSGSGNGHAHGNGAQYSGSLLNSRHLTLTSESSTPTAPLRTLNQQGGKGYFGLRLTQSHSQEPSSFSSPQSSPSHHQLISSTTAAAAAAAGGGGGGGVIPLPSPHSRQTSVDDQRTQLLLSAALGWTGNAINVPHQLSRNTLASEQQRAASRSATPRRLKYTSLRVSTANASFLAMIADANRTANLDGANTNAAASNNNASIAAAANSNGVSVIVAPSHASLTPTPMSSEMLALVPGMANASPAQSKRRDLKIDIHAALSTNPDSPLPTPSRAPSHLSVAAFKKVYAQMYAKAQERMQHAAAIQAQQQQQQHQHQSHTHQVDASQLANGAPTPTPNSLADDAPLMDRDPSLASSLALQHRQDQARRLQQTDRAQAILVATGGLLHLPKQHYRSHSRSHSHGDLKNPSAEVIQALLQSQQSTTATTTTTAATAIASSTTGCTPTDTTMTTTMMATHSTSALTPTETPPPVTHDTDRSHQAPPPNPTVVLTPVLPVTPDAYETTSSASIALQQYMTPSNILNDDTPQFHEAYKQWFREEILRERLMRKQLPRNHSPSRSLFSTPRLNSFDGEAIEVEPLHADAHGELHTPPGCRTPVGSRTPGSSRTPAGTLTAFAVLRESNSCNGSGSNTPMPLMSHPHESEKIGSLLGIGHDSPQSTRLAVTPLQLLNQWRATHNVAKTAPTTPTKVNTAKVR